MAGQQLSKYQFSIRDKKLIPQQDLTGFKEFVNNLLVSVVIKFSLRSQGNDIVPLLYRSDCLDGKVDSSHGSGSLSYQFGTCSHGYAIVP